MKKTVYLGEVQLKYTKAKLPNEISIKSSTDAYNIFKDLIGDCIYHQELFCAMYLTKSNKVMWTEVINIGTHTSCLIDRKAVVKRALIGGCAGIIIAHNHPSGSQTPSLADKKATEDIKQGVNYFDISLLDHIIVCDNDYYSFADNGETSLS